MAAQYDPRSSGEPSPLLDDLVAYYKLDETSGTRIDSAGSNNLTDNNSVGSAAGKIGNAAQFVGVDLTYLEQASPVIASNVFSVSAWIYPTSYNGVAAGGIFYQGTGSSDEGLHLSVFDAAVAAETLLFRYDQDSSSSTADDNSISLNTWQHVVVAFNAGAVAFYVNAVAKGTDSLPGSNLPLTNPFAIGYWFDKSSSIRFFNGEVDEVGIWTRILTASEITQLYNSGSGLTYPF
jgi:hypothetical protein